MKYGKSYPADAAELPINPNLLPLIGRTAEAANKPVNFVQCHRMNENGIVLPHRDPAKMVVPWHSYVTVSHRSRASVFMCIS